jgi:Domain of unknown function (DUF4760)
MSLELVNTLATFGTFLVIAATAIAAVVQLRHARSSNHIAALNEIRETMESADFSSAEQFVMMDLSGKLQDSAFRYQLVPGAKRSDESRALLTKINKVGNFYESMGMLAKAGLVDTNLVVEMWSGVVVGAWDKLAPFIALRRRSDGDALLENFEYLTVLAQDWIAAHPKGTYPAGMRRIGLKDEYLEADNQYAASLAPA